MTSPFAALKALAEDKNFDKSIEEKLNELGAFSKRGSSKGFIKIWDKLSQDAEVFEKIPEEKRKTYFKMI